MLISIKLSLFVRNYDILKQRKVRQMLCYYAVFPTKNLNQDILIGFLWDWLEHSKNKMEGLYIEKTFPFEYEVDHKHLKLQIFDEKYFTIYFSTQDNDKNTHFIVEVIYDMLEEKIHLRFSKETSHDSRYISAVSIPVLFKNILVSPYIKSDIYPLSYKAHHVKDIEAMKVQEHQLPILYMHTTYIDANLLARKMLGLAHVCYCQNQKEEGYIEIIDNHESRIFQLNKKRQSLYQIYELNELLRNEIIKKYKNHMPSYEQLYQNQILHQQNMIMKNAYDYQEEFKKEIKRQQIEVDELKDIYHMLMEDKQKALKQNQKLMQVGQYHDALIYVDHMDKIASYHDCLLQYIQHKAHDLETTQEIYRRLDILNAILKKNGDSI